MKTLTLAEKRLTAIQKSEIFKLAIIAKETIDGEETAAEANKKSWMN